MSTSATTHGTAFPSADVGAQRRPSTHSPTRYVAINVASQVWAAGTANSRARAPRGRRNLPRPCRGSLSAEAGALGRAIPIPSRLRTAHRRRYARRVVMEERVGGAAGGGPPPAVDAAHVLRRLRRRRGPGRRGRERDRRPRGRRRRCATRRGRRSSRMVKRGLLRRVAVGRQAYFGLTAFGRRTILDGRERTQASDVVDRDWDGRWTLRRLLAAGRSAARAARAEVAAGLGRLRDAAGRPVGRAARGRRGRPAGGPRRAAARDAFRGEPVAPSETSRMVAQCYDLDGLAAGYDAFLARWQPFAAEGARDETRPAAARASC